jgi:hypothetical protein
MPHAAGTRLGPYELVSPLGAGGMGEVWRGKDTRLERSVAVKILPTGFAEDEERRIRFEREAKTISSLSHPHICTLFDGPGTPRRLFQLPERPDRDAPVFEDATPDGNRFLLNVPVKPSSSVGFHVVVSWRALLEARGE